MTILFRLAFVAALVGVVVFASLPHPAPLPGNPGDKLQHFLAFATLALLAALAYPRAGLVTLLVVLSGFGALIELVQAIPALGRHPDLADWAVDTLATAMMLGLIDVTRRLQRRGLAQG
ncbi:hypothetical protein [Sphingomicrobium astaxanthinifaciens]|uniref:hypothetical protein n=1 Tax=Sphingomicrobium astaxanthinifaciens TaxID=1227949 RepID=UPI001FCB7E24|nr:hypothetical protein [Sphingomicrobium astaxanthinifaciens]MCJ7420400.1 hypothetical protein [Sphingomicrobium astaxanthinifaciens]